MSATGAEQLILAIDVGTLSVRAVAYDRQGREQAFADRPVALNALSATHIEQDPLQMTTALQAVIGEVLAAPVVADRGVAAAGLACQRSSVVAWERGSDTPLSPVLSWQDRRGADYLVPLAAHSATIKSHSGLFLSPHYGASKLRWLLDHNAGVAAARRSKRLVMGPLAAFIITALVEGHPGIVDHVNASRTQLLDLQERSWSPELLQLFGLSADLLPACQPTQSAYGLLRGTTIPLQAVNGDQNAAIHGTGRLDDGTLIVNLGTGAFVLLPTGSEPIHHPRLLTSLANSTSDGANYLLEGTVNGAGAAFSWAGEQWGERDLAHRLDEWLVEVAEPPVFVNAVGGLGSPLWNGTLQPHFLAEGTLAQKTVAIAESIVFLIKINLEAMTNTGQNVKRIRVSGGLSGSSALCQLLADATERVVVRPEVKQATALGIARLAARGQAPSVRTDTSGMEGDYFLPRANRGLQARFRLLCSELGWR